jgi:hypothetical protein
MSRPPRNPPPPPGDARDTDLQIVDDTAPDTLTVTEVKRLKWLAHQIGVLQWLLAAGIALIGIFGIDHVMAFLKAHLR